MENEISPGVKVQVRVRDDAPTKQTPAPRFAAEISERVPPAPQGAAPFRGSGAERRRGLQSGETASMEKTECSADHSFSTRHLPDPGDPSVLLSLDSSPKRGAKGVDQAPAPQGAAATSPAPYQAPAPQGAAATSPAPYQAPAPQGAAATSSAPQQALAPQGAAPLRGSPQCAHWGKGSPDSDMEQAGKDSTQQIPPSPSPPALRAHFERLCAEAEALHRSEPGFDLDAALHDPRFLRLTAPGVGVPVADAWYALHRDEYAEDLRRESMERAAAAVAAGRLRPREGGRTSGGELMGTDPRHMSPAQRAELKERIKRGEKVYPGV